MKTHTLSGRRTKKSRSRLYALLCLGLAACGDKDPLGVDENEVTNPCQAASSISMGESISGQLNANDCVQRDGAYGDRWSLSLSSQTDVRIDLTSSSFDAFLELRDDVGNVIAMGNVIAPNDNASGRLNSRIIQTLSANVHETRSTQRIRVGRRQRNQGC